MPTDQTFSFTGGEQTWSVPAGVRYLDLEAWGAEGGDGAAGSGSGDYDINTGANGGHASGRGTVTPGETLYIYVGGAGATVTGGWPNGGDGGNAGSDEVQAGGGGGASDIRRGGNTASDRMIVAGGGGGGGAAYASNDSDYPDSAPGGAGGAAAEDGGDADNYSDSPAYGGTGGGAGGASGNNGATAEENSDGVFDACGGGGGGGANGGGGGGANGMNYSSTTYASGAGGGGGDGSVAALSTGSMSVGANTGDGQVTISYVVAPSMVSLDASTDREITLNWSNQETYDEIRIWRALASGAADPADYSTVATLSSGATSYTDTDLLDGERYYYRVAGVVSGYAPSPSAEFWGQTNQPAPTNLSTSNTDATSTDLDWTANHNNGQTRIEYKRSSASTWTQAATQSYTNDTYTLSGLLNGEQYDVRVVATTEHTETVDQ